MLAEQLSRWENIYPSRNYVVEMYTLLIIATSKIRCCLLRKWIMNDPKLETVEVSYDPHANVGCREVQRFQIEKGEELKSCSISCWGRE